MNGMIVRIQLAVMDFNDSMCKKQAATADGSLSYKQVFSCVTQSWVAKKVMKKENRSYLEPLLRLTPDMTPDNNKNYLPILGDIPKNIDKERQTRESNTNKKHQIKVFVIHYVYVYTLMRFFFNYKDIFRFHSLFLCIIGWDVFSIIQWILFANSPNHR